MHQVSNPLPETLSMPGLPGSFSSTANVCISMEIHIYHNEDPSPPRADLDDSSRKINSSSLYRKKYPVLPGLLMDPECVQA